MIKKIFSLLVFLHINSFAQKSLTYSGTGTNDLEQATHISERLIPSLEESPTGFTFGDNGYKFYIVGKKGERVVQSALSIPYELSSTGTIEKSFSVSNEESEPEDVAFNNVGTKMYIVGNTGDDITEYLLSTAWDVSSIDTSLNPPVVFSAGIAIELFVDPMSVIAGDEGDLLKAMTFNDDGSKIFVADSSSDVVYMFELSTPYDISAISVSAVMATMPIAGEASARGIAFNVDGTNLYIIGTTGDDINTYILNTGYDLTSFNSSSNSVTLPENTQPEGILLHGDGSKFYVVGSANAQINEYTLAAAYNFGSVITNVSANTFLASRIEEEPRGMVFNSDGTKLFIAGNQLDRISEISLTVPYDINTGRLTGDLYVKNQEETISGLAFNDGAAEAGKKLFIIGTQEDEINVYTFANAYDLSLTPTNIATPIDVSAYDSEPTDIFFNTDGTTLFILGNNGNDISQFSLSPAYDVTGVTDIMNLDIVFGLTSSFAGSNKLDVDSSPMGMAFNTAGDKLYIAGNGSDDITEITLGTNFDLIGTQEITNTFDIDTEETSVQDVIFNPDGSKFFIVGLEGVDMNQYYIQNFLLETPNDGSIDVSTPLIITLNGDTFADANADNLLDIDDEFTIANLPDGLIPVFTLSNGDTVATLTFTGKASSHLISDEAAANLSFIFTDDAFTISNAADVTFAIAHTAVLGFKFIECADDEIVYNGTVWSGGNGLANAPDNSAVDLLLAINVQADITITADTNCNCLHVKPGQTLSVANGISLTVANALELEGDLRLLGSAQLNQTHLSTKNVSGTGKLYKDIKGTLVNIYQSSFWSSPVTTNGNTYTIAGVLKDGTELLNETNTPLDITFSSDLDGITGTAGTVPIQLSTKFLARFTNAADWTRNISETATALNPTEGFNKKSTGATGQNYTFVGKPNDGDYTSEITSGNYSLLGNPYPSPIIASDFITYNTLTTGAIEGTLYFYEAGTDVSHARSEYLGGYATQTLIAATPASGLGGTGTKTPSENIGIGQAFFVQSSASGGTITFNNAQRAFDITGANTEFFSKNSAVKKQTTDPVLKIGFEFPIDGEIFHRQVAIGFKEGLTNGYENSYDGEMWDYKSTDIALKIDGINAPYSISGIESFNHSLEIPLKVQINHNEAVTFKVAKTEYLETPIYLFDNVANKYYEITTNSATLNIAQGIYDDRFFITFKQATLLNIEDNNLRNFSVLNKKDGLVISSLDFIEEVLVYNLLGQKVNEFKNTNKLTEIKINTSGLKKGFYILKVKNSKVELSKKIIIN